MPARHASKPGGNLSWQYHERGLGQCGTLDPAWSWRDNKLWHSRAVSVLKPGGLVYCQVPFQIGFHPGPFDYWRSTRQGLEHLFGQPGWNIKQLSISLGHGSGFYRIAVEFLAVTMSCFWGRMYRAMKGIVALILYPLEWFDLLTEFSREKDRIPSGYFCIVEKPGHSDT